MLNIMMRRLNWSLAVALLGACMLTGCGHASKPGTPVVGFLDFVEDDTLAKARQGFLEALDEHGFSEKKGTIEVVYRCAQGDQPTLIQACQDLISRHPRLIATCPTLSTIVAAQRTQDIPILMMVSPRPDIVGLTRAGGGFQSNLLGAYETLDYLKEGPAIIRQVVPQARIGWPGVQPCRTPVCAGAGGDPKGVRRAGIEFGSSPGEFFG